MVEAVAPTAVVPAAAVVTEAEAAAAVEAVEAEAEAAVEVSADKQEKDGQTTILFLFRHAHPVIRTHDRRKVDDKEQIFTCFDDWYRRAYTKFVLCFA